MSAAGTPQQFFSTSGPLTTMSFPSGGEFFVGMTLWQVGGWRCDGLTLRGTRCRFRACYRLEYRRGNTLVGQHYACKIHNRQPGRWW